MSQGDLRADPEGVGAADQYDVQQPATAGVRNSIPHLREQTEGGLQGDNTVQVVLCGPAAVPQGAARRQKRADQNNARRYAHPKEAVLRRVGKKHGGILLSEAA